jgi:N-acetyl-anhydromuramyl-L-alanine amidase AmpD
MSFTFIETQEELDAELVSARRDITEVVVHWTANFIDQDINAEEINRIHIARGFDGIGYHYVILRDGSLQRGRNINRAGAHALRRNANSIGIAFVGGINLTSAEASRLGGYQAVANNGRYSSAESLTDAQFDTFDMFMDSFFKVFPYGQAFGHMDTDPNRKPDPGFDVAEYCRTKFNKNIFASPFPENSYSLDALIALAKSQRGIA